MTIGRQSPAEAVREFHLAFGIGIADRPICRPDAWKFRIDLLREEFTEYVQAASSDDLVGVADALADMVYVIYGTAYTYGIPLDEAIAEVHRSNMSKLDSKGQPLLDEQGKVVKSDGYQPPDIRSIVARHDQIEE